MSVPTTEPILPAKVRTQEHEERGFRVEDKKSRIVSRDARYNPLLGIDTHRKILVERQHDLRLLGPREGKMWAQFFGDFELRKVLRKYWKFYRKRTSGNFHSLT